MKSYGAYSPLQRIFWLSSVFGKVHRALSRLSSAFPSLGTDYIDRFMEPVLLHDPAGTSKTSF